jgi:hypothetical protein
MKGRRGRKNDREGERLKKSGRNFEIETENRRNYMERNRKEGELREGGERKGEKEGLRKARRQGSSVTVRDGEGRKYNLCKGFLFKTQA